MGDFGVPIAIFVMVLVDAVLIQDVYTEVGSSAHILIFGGLLSVLIVPYYTH